MQQDVSTDIEKMIKNKVEKVETANTNGAFFSLADAQEKLIESRWAMIKAGEKLDEAIRYLSDEPEWKRVAMMLQDIKTKTDHLEFFTNIESGIISAKMKLKMDDPSW